MGCDWLVGLGEGDGWRGAWVGMGRDGRDGMGNVGFGFFVLWVMEVEEVEEVEYMVYIEQCGWYVVL